MFVARKLQCFSLLVLLSATSPSYTADAPDDCCSKPKGPLPPATARLQQTRTYQPQIDPDRPHVGPVAARITIVEYGDFQCPVTNRARIAVRTVVERHPNDVRFFFKQLP